MRQTFDELIKYRLEWPWRLQSTWRLAVYQRDHAPNSMVYWLNLIHPPPLGLPVRGVGICPAKGGTMIGITIEHAQIIDWTRTRGGYPGVNRPSPESQVLVICFCNETGEVSWDEWITVFEHGAWAFIYQDRTPEGELSRTWRITPRFAEEQKWTQEIKTVQAS